jgi:hypothetical protein
MASLNEERSMGVSKTIVILQSNYIPWKGYFDLIAAADEFLIFDEVQFTRRDWRNRNKIVAAGKPRWLSIPVQSKGNYSAPINAIDIADFGWAANHWATIKMAYRRAHYFPEIGPVVEAAYCEAAGLRRLTDINELFIRTVAALLGLRTSIVRADCVPRTTTNPTQRLVDICQARGATTYLSGPAARSYIRGAVFAEAGIALRYADYSGYPIYTQAMVPFEHGVSILDPLYHCGAGGARGQLKSVSLPGSLTAPE